MHDGVSIPEASGSDPIQRLVEAFHDLLDEALIVAIACDYDVHETSGYNAAHVTLLNIAQNVPSEEATGFNPSGIPRVLDPQSDSADDGEATAATSSGQKTNLTDKSDLSSAISSSASTGATQHDAPRLTSFNHTSNEAKAQVLGSMFKELKEYDVSYALKKSDGNFQVALDDLLNIQYLQSTGQQIKGVDGFFQPNEDSAFKSKKGGKSTHLATSDLSRKRDFQNEDIGYVAERLDLPFDEVSLVYSQNQNSRSETIIFLLDQYISHGIESRDVEGKKRAEQLTQKFRHVPEKYMTTIIQVTGSISKFADDLAALLNKHYSKQSRSHRLNLDYRLTPLPHEDIEEQTASRPGWAAVSGSKASSAPTWLSSSTPGSPELSDALLVSEKLSEKSRVSTNAAANLHRKGASNPLYRQAASYYSDRAREDSQRAQQATYVAANLHVEKQSSTFVVDLHGVTVRDGLRIARQRTEAWWQSLGDFKSTKAREQSLTIITGVGRHSAGGVSRLRQAVAAALLQDGWKIQVETGKFIIVGRR